MPIADTDVPNSPGWWMQRLAKELTDPLRVRRLQQLRNRYRGTYWAGLEQDGLLHSTQAGGEEALAYVSKNTQRRAAHEMVVRRARTNFARLVVDVRRQRMHVRSFSTALESGADGDDVVQQTWRANCLPQGEQDVYRLMGTYGEGYVQVAMPDVDVTGLPDADGGPVDDDELDPDAGLPIITYEDPFHMIASVDPARPHQVRAALKMWSDPDAGLDFVYLWLPGQLHVASRPQQQYTSGTSGQLAFDAGLYDWDPVRSASFATPVVPVVPFWTEERAGDFEDHVAILDRIDNDVFMRDSIALLQAFRQRAITGELPPVDEHDNPIDYNDIFTSDPGALWVLPPAASLWESAQADLTPVRGMASDDIKMLAMVTSTPLYLVSSDAANQSAEGVTSMREGLVYTVEDRMARAGIAWSRVMSLALRFQGEVPRASIRALQTNWMPAERFSLTEKAQADSLTKTLTWRQRQESIWQMDPGQIKQAESDRLSDAMLAPMLTPPAPAAPKPAAVPGGPPVPGQPAPAAQTPAPGPQQPASPAV